MRPWEAVSSGARTWEGGAGFNRTLSLYREVATTTAGVQPMQEFNGAQQALVGPGVPCNIQIDRERGKPLADVPGDIQARTTWKIFIAPGDAVVFAIAFAGAVLTRDVLVDDAGLKYQVSQANWHSLSGWQLRAELLQA